MLEDNQMSLEPDLWSLYIYAMKSPSTREKYQKRLEKFFNFLGLEGSSIEEKSNGFVKTLDDTFESSSK